MSDHNQNKKSVVLTKGIRIAAIYLIIAGGIGILWPLTGLGPHHPEFQAKSFAYKLGSYTRENVMNILFLISGIGILRMKLWARKMALVILPISAIYSANSFAWGFSNGPPSLDIRLISFSLFCLWNGLWFYLIFRVKPTGRPGSTGDRSDGDRGATGSNGVDPN
ncbi:MAG: hypothetical protein ACOC8I_02855 [Desulfosalsimonas sp.]